MRRTCTIFTVILVATSAFAQSRAVSRLDKLEVGVERAEAIRAIKVLQTTYHGYLDNGLWNDIADLLSANATADFAGAKVTGKDAIKQHLMQEAGRTEPGLANGQLNTHLLMQPIINLGPDGKNAMGTWHELAMLGQNAGKPDATASWVGGIYENTYILENGVWKIASIGLHEQYRGNYSDPGQKAPPKWDIPYHFEAAHVGLTIPPSALQGSSINPASTNQPDIVRLAGLAARLNRMEDETAVQNMQHIYGYYLDRKHFDDIADLFAKGGTWNGKTNVRATLASLYGAPAIRYGELFDHIMLGTVTSVAPDGKTARARSTELAQIGLQGEYARWELGIYENRFVKEGGIWKLQAVNYYKRLVANYDQGWAKQGSGDFSFPAFHYRNPVTGKTPRYPKGVVQVSTIATTFTPPNIYKIDPPISALELTLARAIGVDASENLNSAYGYYLDESAWDAVADMMSNKGVFDLSSVGIYIGRERARKALHLRYPNSGRGPTFFTIHELVQPVTHISDDGRVARNRVRLFQGGGSANGSSASWTGGTYENRAVFEDGEWKFYEKDLQHSFSATYKDGWGKAAAPRAAPAPTPNNAKGPAPAANTKAKQPSVAAQFPPDLPERTEQYAFPQVAEPSYHYVNPVSGRKPPILLEAPPIP